LTNANAQTKPERTDSSPAGIDPNYQYWRDHGQEWVKHYDYRKTRLVLYHIQELMLTTYVEQHAAHSARPLRVLEFGCGVGRHLRNLSKLPNTDVHGYDQSRAMAEGALRWATREWFQEHVHVGLPTGRLPFADGDFDIVYSAEVLVHVRPEHLEGILSEMMRVCRGHVLHLETSPDYPLVSGEHSGCWRHDLPASYERLGKACEVLPRGYECHTPFRVTVGQAPAWTWPEQVLAMYRRLERDIDAGFTATDSAVRAHEATIEGQQTTIGNLNTTIESLRSAVTESEATVVAREQQIDLVNTWLADAQALLKTQQESIADLSGRVNFWVGENEKLKQQYAELAAARDAALNEIVALRNLLDRVQRGWEADRDVVMQLLEQRRRFVEQATGLLNHKITKTV
jgi:SAM-dependent methyltransferase